MKLRAHPYCLQEIGSTATIYLFNLLAKRKAEREHLIGIKRPRAFRVIDRRYDLMARWGSTPRACHGTA